MIEFPRFKKWFHPVAIDQNESAVLSENSQHILHGRIYAAVIPLLNGKRNVHEIADQFSNDFGAARVYFHLLQLEKNGFLEDGRNEDLHPSQVFLNQICEAPQDIDEWPATVYLISLGSCDTDLSIRFNDPDFKFLALDEFHSVSISPGSLCVVITPDYFEKALIEINRKAISEKICWLPFKPSGFIPWLGPLFEHDGTGCLECLLHRLRGHRVIESYYFKKNPPVHSSGLSTGQTPFSLDIAFGFLKLELAKLHARRTDDTLKNRVLTIDLKNLEVTRHRLIGRPQCPVCGNSTSCSVKDFHAAKPMKLSSRLKSGYQHSGERIIQAEETCRNLADHMSPITGTVGFLRRMTDIPDFFGYYYTSTWPTLGSLLCWFHRARISPTGISTGKGTTDAQARASAMGEAIERYCTQYEGYEPRIQATYQAVQDRAVDPDSLISYSRQQYEHREMWRRKAETSYVPEPFEKKAEIDWTPAWSLTRKQWRLIPSAYVYYNYPLDRGGLFFNGDSNGVAAGNCLEETLLQAFFELVERDAVGIWWYNRIQRPELDLSSFEISYVDQLRNGLSDNGYHLYCLDLTTDLGIPVIAAVAIHTTDPKEDPLIGLGAHLDIQIALIRSLSELGQSWNLRSTFQVNKYFQQMCGRLFSDMEYIHPDSAARLRSRHEFTSPATEDFLEDIEYCVDLIKEKNMEMFAVDLTRPDVDLRVVRVIVPGLVHFWPRFAPRRLFQVPVKMGWFKMPLSEEDLNPVPFYF